MANTLLRDKTRALRSNGLSLNEIVARLNAPKSTVRYWCKDITLSKNQLMRIHKKQELGGVVAAEKLRKKRISLIQSLINEGAKEVGRLSPRELLLVGAALYWAEGYRKGDGEFGFTNSDPGMVRLTLRWLMKCCSVEKKRIKLRVCINSQHKNRSSAVHRFWSKTTGIPLTQFSSPTFIKVGNQKKYLNTSNYMGTLRIKVQRGTNLRRKIMGWIDGIARNS